MIAWIKTPVETALERGQARPEAADQQQHSRKTMLESIKKHQAALERPDADELCIELDGTLPFEQQYVEFMQRLSALS